MSLLNLYTEC